MTEHFIDNRQFYLRDQMSTRYDIRIEHKNILLRILYRRDGFTNLFIHTCTNAIAANALSKHENEQKLNVDKK